MRLALTLLPILLLFGLIARFGVDVPFTDEWLHIRLIEKSFQGTLSLPDLLEQRGEHRQFFPRIVVLALARLSGWNIRWEAWATAIFSLACFLIMAGQWGRTRRSLKLAGAGWTLPMFSLIFFSMNQWSTWLWGITMPLNMLPLIAGIAALAVPPFGWPNAAAGLLCGLIASFCFSSGLLFWPIGLGLILILAPRALKRKAAASWAIAGLLVIGGYALGYHKPPDHPPLFLPFQQPGGWLAYFFTFLGTPICGFNLTGALLAGLLGVGLLGVLSGLLRAQKIAAAALAPYWALAAYALACAALAATGRLGFGVAQAMNSHYINLANLLWLCDIALLAIALDRGALKRVWAGAALSMAACLIVSYAWGTLWFLSESAMLRLIRDELVAENQEHYVLPLRWPHEREIGKYAALVKKRRLSLFRDPAAPPPPRPYALVAGALEGQVAATPIDGERMSFSGWAADVARGAPPESILVLVDGKLSYRGRVFAASVDIARRYGRPGLLLCGFEFVFPRERLRSPKGRPRVQFLAVSKSGEASELPLSGL